MVAYFATVADLRFSRSSQQVFAISFRGAKVTRREGNAMSFLDFFEGGAFFGWRRWRVGYE